MAEKFDDLMTLVNRAKDLFVKEYNQQPTVIVYAPGRVNLIGEHTDYNDGFVMPMALPLVTVIVGKRINGGISTVMTNNKTVDEPFSTTIEMPNRNALVRKITPGPPNWSNYIKGVISNYAAAIPPAFLAVIDSSVPNGGGLSSSAALEVSTYLFLEALCGPTTISLTDKALACQKAEHDYANVPCGIMDQFISILGKKDNALLIDCRQMTSTLIPFKNPNIAVLITNSNVKHELSGSEYSARRTQCEEAAQLLKKKALRDATPEDIDYLISINTNNDIVKRARHVVTEIKRTRDGADALKAKDYRKFGEKMVESHNSLRDDYNVSCPELDQLVALAMQVEGVLGSRMTGGGFGGCTVTLVEKNAVDKCIDHLKKNYKGKPTFYVCQASDGAQVMVNKCHCS